MKTAARLNRLSLIIVLGVLAGGCGPEDEQTIQVGFQLKGNCSVTLAGTPAPGAISAGTTVALTATGSCNSGTPEYHISVRDPAGAWSTVKVWGTANTANWDTTGLSDGDHRLLVKIRAVNSGDTWEGYDYSRVYTLGTSGGPCTAATLDASPVSPQTAGTAVTLTGAATCPSGTTAEYRFVVRGPDMVWRQAQAWSTGLTYAWDTTSAQDGRYTYYFYVRDQGTATPYDAYAGPLHFDITSSTGTCTSATLSASPASPQTPGATVTLTAASTCTNGASPHYRFVAYKPDNSYVQLRGWGSATTHAWDTTGQDTGTWQLQVYSRNQDSTSPAEGISAKLPYTLSAVTLSSVLLSQSSAGAQGNGASTTSVGQTAISANGRYVVFESAATNLVAGDTNGISDIFLRDRTLTTTTRISLDTSGQQLIQGGSAPAISDDGRYIAFATTASIDAADTNGVSDIYLYDRNTATYELVSVTAGGAAATGTQANLSANGQFVAWTTTSGQVYRLNRTTGAVDRADVDGIGTAANGVSSGADISSGGRYVAFTSAATNLLIASDTNGVTDVFLKDLSTDAVTLISATEAGTQLASASWGATISDDGFRVTFLSAGAAIPSMATGGKVQAYVRIHTTEQVIPVSVNTAGAWGDDDTADVAISGDGTMAVFSSLSSNLQAGDVGGLEDVFSRHLSGAETRRLSIDLSAGDPNGWSRLPAISRGADYAVFTSAASDLVNGDANAASDIFFTDLTPWPSTPKKVIFAAGSGYLATKLYTVNTDGSALTATPGWGNLSLVSPTAAGRVRTVHPFTHLGVGRDDDRYRLWLPGGKRAVTWYIESDGSSKVGALLSEDDGTVTSLYSVAGSSNNDLSQFFAVSASGTYMAGYRPHHKQLVLMRTDGNTFPNSASSVAWTLSSSYAWIPSPTQHVTDTAVYVWARPTSAAPHQYNLWWAPVSGSQIPSVVTLPVPGGAGPAVYTGMASAEDGSKVAVVAGSATATQDVAVVDGTTGQAIKISTVSAAYQGCSGTWGYGKNGCQLAVSSNGTWVAFVRYNPYSGTGYGESLFVARADGTDTPYEVSNTSNFSATTMYFYSLKWMDDNALVFAGHGGSEEHVDIYRYLAAGQRLRNVTKQTDTTKPFSMSTTGAVHAVQGMWRSPNGSYLYYLDQRQGPSAGVGSMDIHAIPLSTWQVTSVTSGLVVGGEYGYPTAGAYTTCADGSRMFFAARDMYGIAPREVQVYTFDLNAPATPTQLTNIGLISPGTDNEIHGLSATADCGHLTFGVGASDNSLYDAYVVQTTAPVTVTRIARAGNGATRPVIKPEIVLSADRSQAVLFQGADRYSHEMKVSSTSAGSSAVPQSIWTGPTGGSYSTWTVFGVE